MAVRPLMTYGAPSGLQPISPRISPSFRVFCRVGGFFRVRPRSGRRSSFLWGSRIASLPRASLRSSPREPVLDKLPQPGVGFARPVARLGPIASPIFALGHGLFDISVRRRRVRSFSARQTKTPTSDAPCSCATKSERPAAAHGRATRPAAAPGRACALQLRIEDPRPAAAPRSSDAPCSCAAS